MKKTEDNYWIDVDLFGDICEIEYDSEKNRMVAVGQVGSAELERLLLAVAETFGKEKTQRAQRIAKNARELAKDYCRQQGHKIRTRAFVAAGSTIKLETKQLVIE